MTPGCSNVASFVAAYEQALVFSKIAAERLDNIDDDDAERYFDMIFGYLNEHQRGAITSKSGLLKPLIFVKDRVALT